MPDEADEELLERFVRGDEAALEVLFRRFGKEVYGWIVRIVRDPAAADDLVVEAFWRAFRGRARFDPGRSFGAWLRRIATNAALDHLRAERASRRRLPSRTSEEFTTTQTDVGVRDAILLALQRLPAKLRVVAILALVEERPHGEIAAALGVPVGTVKSRSARACARLRHELARLGIHS